MSQHDRNLEDSPLTPRFLLKAVGAAFIIISGIVSVVLYVGTLKNEITSLREEFQTYKHETEGRNADNDKQMDRLRTHSEQTDRTIEDIQRKLDVSITILQRIDKKVNGT